MRSPSSNPFVFFRPRPATPLRPGGFRKLDHFTTTIHHQLYQAPIYCWLAEGHLHTDDHQRKGCYFLYMEYRDHSGASCYVSRYFLALHKALNWLNGRAYTFPLPNICREKTCSAPIDPDSSSASPLPLKTSA